MREADIIGAGPMNSIQVVGHLCVDLKPGLGSTKVAAPGELAVVGPMGISMGGAVGNCGRVLADLGVDVSLSACVGNDELGAMARRILGTHHRDVDLAVMPGLATSYSLVVEPEGVDRSFWHHTGANAAFVGDCAVTAPPGTSIVPNWEPCTEPATNGSVNDAFTSAGGVTNPTWTQSTATPVPSTLWKPDGDIVTFIASVAWVAGRLTSYARYAVPSASVPVPVKLTEAPDGPDTTLPAPSSLNT